MNECKISPFHFFYSHKKDGILPSEQTDFLFHLPAPKGAYHLLFFRYFLDVRLLLCSQSLHLFFECFDFCFHFSIVRFHFSFILCILHIPGLQLGNFPALLVNDRCHFRFRIFDILIALSKFQREPAIYHVTVIPHGPSQFKHGPFIGTIEKSHSSSGGIAVIVYAGSEVPFILRIIIQRMKGSQSGGTGAHLVDAIAQFPYPAVEIVDILGIGSHLIIQNRQILPSGIGYFHISAILFNPGFVVYRASIDSILGPIFNRRISYISNISIKK